MHLVLQEMDWDCFLYHSKRECAAATKRGSFTEIMILKVIVINQALVYHIN